MLIIFEGIDGVGKSTQIELLAQIYKNAIITKEPGGTAFGEILREILLEKNYEISKTAEMFLFLADRAEHFEKIIKKHENKWVLCDRSFISGIAYALANAENLDFETLLNLNKIALGGVLPKAKFIFFKISKTQLQNRLKIRGGSDKIEDRGLEYLMKIQNKMAEIFKILGLDVLQIDANNDKMEIHKAIKEFIK